MPSESCALTGPAGLFLVEGRPAGGFLGWRITARFGEALGRLICLNLRTEILGGWWLKVPSAGLVTASFCRVDKGFLIPLQEIEVPLPRVFEMGKLNKDTIIFDRRPDNVRNQMW